MLNKHAVKYALAAMLLSAAYTGADAAAVGVKITEWMYNPTSTAVSPGEFVELTNFGSTAVNLSGWSFDDNSRTPGSESLSSLGMINPGESFLITEASATDFRSAWNLSGAVKVLGGISNNLGRSDEINLYDASSALLDRLTYNDQASPPGGPRTQGVSGRPSSLAAIGANDASQWVLSSVGDVDGSYASLSIGAFSGGDIGSPGKTSLVAPVPLPATVWLLGAGLAGLAGFARKKLQH